MTYLIRLTGALTVLWLGALAAPTALGQNTAQPDPASVSAPVPLTRYVPVLLPPARTAAPTSPPDNWKALNKLVAGNDAMASTMGKMKMMESMEAREVIKAMAHPPAPSPVPETHPQHMHEVPK